MQTQVCQVGGVGNEAAPAGRQGLLRLLLLVLHLRGCCPLQQCLQIVPGACNRWQLLLLLLLLKATCAFACTVNSLNQAVPCARPCLQRLLQLS